MTRSAGAASTAAEGDGSARQGEAHHDLGPTGGWRPNLELVGELHDHRQPQPQSRAVDAGAHPRPGVPDVEAQLAGVMRGLELDLSGLRETTVRVDDGVGD